MTERIKVDIADMRVGLSISDSPDLESLGFGPLHIKDATIEFARHLLAWGASLAYGGDLRQGGFTRTLFELLENYQRLNKKNYERIASFLAWPLHAKMTVRMKAELKPVARFYPTAPPEGLVDTPGVFLPPDTAWNKYIWARSLTIMREEMNRFVQVRLVMGGKRENFLGKYPGLAEEAYMALRDSRPLYLIGAFGGGAKDIIQALNGETPAGLTEDMQFQNEDYRDMAGVYNANAEAAGQEEIDYGKFLKFFQDKGPDALNNGLDAEENQRLFQTVYIPEMISLVLKGLGRLKE